MVYIKKHYHHRQPVVYQPVVHSGLSVKLGHRHHHHHRHGVSVHLGLGR